MMLRRALAAELLKMKGTLALKIALLAPVSVLGLTLFMASSAPFSTLHRNPETNEWLALLRVNLQLWALLMLPLYLTLQTALVAGLDHSDNQWKALFARPVPRWTVYVAKLLVVLGMTVASAMVFASGLLIEGLILHEFDPRLRFALPSPWETILLQTAQVTGLALLPLAIQHWVSLRWRAFSVPVAFGVLAMVITFAMLLSAGPYGSWPQYFPWALPMLVLARHPQNIRTALSIASSIALVSTLLGCWSFCRRDVT